MQALLKSTFPLHDSADIRAKWLNEILKLLLHSIAFRAKIYAVQKENKCLI